jgi:hypothetical protein
MVFEDLNAVIKAIKDVKTVPPWVVEAREYHKKLKALVYGIDFKDRLLRIEHIEANSKKAEARKKYSRPIKDINSKILAPVNNIYSATGGGKEFPRLSEDQSKTLLSKITKVRSGLSLEKWLQTYWSKDLYVVDPAGLIFLEWKDEKAWPTYKSIDRIRNYEADGQSLEFVIFEPKTDPEDETIKIWRVVDDAKDYLIAQKGETYTLRDDFDNPFGWCQGRVNSNLEVFDRTHRLSPLDDVIELEEEMLRDRSILTIHKFLHGFATPYRPRVICPKCHGIGKIGIAKCTDCDGKGYILDKDVTDEIIIPIDLEADNPIGLPSDFAGFISPDLEIWNQYRLEAKTMTNEAFEALWGTREVEVKDQTAMGAVLNLQPFTTKLNAWSDVAQSQESFFTESLANFYLTSKDKRERISVITYGRNYIIQPPSFLLEQFQKSTSSKDPLVIRDRQLVEYLTAKYKNDPVTLRSELLKKDLEPYIFYDIETVEKIYGQREAQRKGLFIEWWESLDDYSVGLEKLKILRDQWIDDALNNLKIEENGKNSSS